MVAARCERNSAGPGSLEATRPGLNTRSAMLWAPSLMCTVLVKRAVLSRVLITRELVRVQSFSNFTPSNSRPSVMPRGGEHHVFAAGQLLGLVDRGRDR